MNTIFKITQRLRADILADLSRPHGCAAERVGFISCRVGPLSGGMVILAQGFHTVADADYLDDPRVGAMMGPGAIRKALQLAYNQPFSMFHVHLHDHEGQTGFSPVDLRESAKFVPDFFNVRAGLPHGALVLSRSAGCGLCWYPGRRRPTALAKIAFVGAPLTLIQGHD